MKVFLSYARGKQSRAERLYRDLVQFGSMSGLIVIH